jgi:excisionase family DNA binding protein
VAALTRLSEALGTTPGAETPGRLLDVEDVAEILGMKRDWIYAEVRAGRLPHVRFGRTVRFRRESIDAWIAASERGKIPSQRNRPGGARHAPGHGTEGTSSHARQS